MAKKSVKESGGLKHKIVISDNGKTVGEFEASHIMAIMILGDDKGKVFSSGGEINGKQVMGYIALMIKKINNLALMEPFASSGLQAEAVMAMISGVEKTGAGELIK